MTIIDYEAIGFKAGLEIHQQLKGERLFSKFPAVIKEGDPDFTFTRVLRPSVGEVGSIDIAASHEQTKAKRFVYQGYYGLTGLVEADDEPVSEPSVEAIKTSVMVSKMLGMKLQQEVHVMRKVVVDGSNTSGFQRTMIIASEGMINDVRVHRLCLEEDSCKIVSRSQNEDVYNLSRLGIPLIEITTHPDIRSSQQLKQVAGSIGMVLRSTKRVKRGLGTIRQDVNISVDKGSRVEIKGVQDLQLMPLIADNEALRQLSLVKLKDDIREVSLSKIIDFTNIKLKTAWIEKKLLQGSSILGVVVRGFAGIFGRELMSGYRVGTEIAGYAKAWGFGGVIHTDEDPEKYGLKTWDDHLRLAKASSNDAIILVVGSKRSSQKLISKLLVPRIKQLKRGVPSEVRKALDNGFTQYLRPMPGSARMYPETDVRVISLKGLVVNTPELISNKISRLSDKFKIDKNIVSLLCRLERDELFERWALKLPPALVADVLVSKEKDLKKRHGITIDISRLAEDIFSNIHKGLISKDAIEDIMLDYSKRGVINWDDYKPIDDYTLREEIKKVIKKDNKAPPGVIIGAVRNKLKGRVDGRRISSMLKELKR